MKYDIRMMYYLNFSEQCRSKDNNMPQKSSMHESREIELKTDQS